MQKYKRKTSSHFWNIRKKLFFYIQSFPNGIKILLANKCTIYQYTICLEYKHIIVVFGIDFTVKVCKLATNIFTFLNIYQKL